MNKGNKNGYSYHYIYEYLPTKFEATVEQKGRRNLVLKFRDGDYQTIYKLILNGIEDIISDDKAQWTICCIPAHSASMTQKRFAALIEQLSNDLEAKNGYNLITVREDRTGSVFNTISKSILTYLSFNNNGIIGNRIILIDDVIKRGRSFYEVSDKLDTLGASKVIGFFIAHTINPDRHQQNDF